MTGVGAGVATVGIGTDVHLDCTSASEGEPAEGAMVGEETFRRFRGLPSVGR
jgi:hypothetical protein